jgi:hypothetical protein
VDEPPRRVALLAFFLASGSLAWAALKLPVIASAEGFLFLDYGANLTLQHLLDAGYRPVVDFFYPYGLLPLLAGRGALGLLGRTPWAYLALVGVCHGLLAWGMARVVVAARLGWPAVALIVAALPYTVPPTYPNLAHGLEAALLVHALAEHASRRPGRALTLLATCALVKPSMAMLYGVFLLISVFFAWWRTRPARREVARVLLPPTAAAVGLAGLLAAWFGPGVLLESLWPAKTAALYTHWNYGFFFGGGRNFWLPADAGPRHYLGTHRGFWIASTLALLAGGAFALARSLRDRGDLPPALPIVATCALLHAGFILFFFGGEVSWLYYPYLLTLGAAALSGLGRRWSAVTLALALAALAADRTIPREVRDSWAPVGPRPRLAGLWTTPEAAAEWRAVLDLTRSGPAAVLTMSGAAPQLYPQFAPDVSSYLIPGLEGTSSVARKTAVLRESMFIIVPTARTILPGDFAFLTTCPGFREELAARDLIHAGDRFLVYRSRGAQAAGPATWSSIRRLTPSFSRSSTP